MISRHPNPHLTAPPPLRPAPVSSPTSAPQIATKQFVGMGKRGGHIYALGGSVWNCGRALDAAEVVAVAQATAPECGLELSGVQSPTGELARFDVSGSGCGGWMPPEYRMCANHLKGRPEHSLLLSNGDFYSQPTELAASAHALGGLCREGALFHMQEWKKRWAHDGTDNVDPHARFDAFYVSETGLHALPDRRRRGSET